MKVLRRLEGRERIVEAKDGSIWLCRRVKRKKDSRRRKVLKKSIIHVPIRLLYWPGRDYNPIMFECYYDMSILDELSGFQLPENIEEMYKKVNTNFLKNI